MIHIIDSACTTGAMWVVYLGDRLQIFCATNTTQARFRGHRLPHRGLSGRGNRVGHWCCACRECSADNCFLRWLLAVSRQTGANKILRYTQIKHRHGIPTEQESISRCDENVGLTFPEPNRTFRTGGVKAKSFWWGQTSETQQYANSTIEFENSSNIVSFGAPGTTFSSTKCTQRRHRTHETHSLFFLSRTRFKINPLLSRL